MLGKMFAWFILVILLAALSLMAAEKSQLISVAPFSINVSEGVTVAFECQTMYGQADVTFGLLLFPDDVMRKEIQSETLLDGGGTLVNTTFEATAEANETMVICVASSKAQPNVSETEHALLLVQGPPAGVSDLGVEYEDVCCTLVTWDDPYTLSGVPITGYSITVNNMSTSPDTGTPGNMLCLAVPGSYVVTVTALIMNDAGTIAGDVAQVIADIPEVSISLSICFMHPTSVTVGIAIKTSGQCALAAVTNVTLSLNGGSIFVSTSDVNEANETILATATIPNGEIPFNTYLQATAIIAFSNGLIIPTSTFNFSTFDVQTVNYSISSVGVVCVECELVPGTQAQGCHVILDCDDGDVIEQNLFRSGLTASGCLQPSAAKPANCSIFFYDIENNNSISTDPAAVIANVEVPATAPITGSSTVTPHPTVTMLVIPTQLPEDATHGITIVVLSITVGVLVVVVIAILLTLLIVSVCFYKSKKQIIGEKTTESENTSAHVEYENTKIPTKIEMQECPAYATLTHAQ